MQLSSNKWALEYGKHNSYDSFSFFSYSSGVKRPTTLPACCRIKNFWRLTWIPWQLYNTTKSTPAGPATPETPSRPVNADSIMERSEIPVGEDVIRTCVTPRKVQSVYATLQKEKERHRCAVKLLPYFFSDEELKGSNTDGTHGKHPLDSSKLNSLRVLVFSKFPVECTTERDKLWRQIKAKINDRCRAIKYAKRAN